MLRVLVIVNATFGYSGISNVVANYYIYQNKDRIHMDLVSINPVYEGMKKALEENGSINYVLSCRNKNPLKYVFQLAKIIKNGKYEIVHVHGNSATIAVELLAAKIAGCRVRIAHSHNTKCDHVVADNMLRPIFNSLYTCGCACGQEAGEWLYGSQDFNIISNGIDVEKYCYKLSVRDEMREKYGLSNKLVIGHVGRFSLQKNHKKLVEVFAEIAKTVDNAVLVLVGDGELKSDIEQSVSQHGLDVRFVGLSTEVEKWLQAFDIIIFPSLFEGLPLGLVEAQAAALPCLLSDTISPMTKVTDFVEFLSLEADARTWTLKALKMLDGYDRESAGEIAKRQIIDRGFDIDQNCKELASMYEKLVLQ